MKHAWYCQVCSRIPYEVILGILYYPWGKRRPTLPSCTVSWASFRTSSWGTPCTPAAGCSCTPACPGKTAAIPSVKFHHFDCKIPSDSLRERRTLGWNLSARPPPPPSLVRAVLDANTVALLLRHRLALLADLLVALLNHLLARHEPATNRTPRCKKRRKTFRLSDLITLGICTLLCRSHTYLQSCRTDVVHSSLGNWMSTLTQSSFSSMFL